MLVILRFRVPDAHRPAFDAAVGHLETHLRACPGLLSLERGTAVDDEEFHALVMTWDLPRSWRTAFGGQSGRAAFLPVMAWLLDEPSAYAGPRDDTFNLPRGASR